jgi:hypothetical protein
VLVFVDRVRMSRAMPQPIGRSGDTGTTGTPGSFTSSGVFSIRRQWKAW